MLKYWGNEPLRVRCGCAAGTLSPTGVFKTTEEWGFAAPAIFKINLLYGYIDLMTSPPYTDG